MVNVTLYGTKENLNEYYKHLKLSLRDDVQIVESIATDNVSGQVIISIKSNDLSIPKIRVDGFEKIGFKALVILDPMLITYTKSVGSSDVKIKQEDTKVTNELNEYEEVEIYEKRISAC